MSLAKSGTWISAVFAAFVLISLAVAEQEEEPCRLWLAPSNLSTEKQPKFGLFAGEQGFARDEIIPSHEIAIPVFDFLQGPAASRSQLNRAVVDFLETSMWLAEYAGSQFESNSSTSAYIPGIGILANHHTGISNVDWLQASIVKRGPDEFQQSIKGRAHPSRGVITPYYNASMRATTTIQPGMELFAHFGEPASEEDEIDLYQERLTRRDYENADKVLDKIFEFMDLYGEQMSDELKDDVLDFMLETILEGADEKGRAKLIRSLIPAHPRKLQRVKDAGGTFAYRNQDMIKDLDWLEERGLCVDNLRPGKSTIPNAGRGAFANRPIKAESVISPVPMIPILNEEVLDLYSDAKEVISNGKIQYVLDDSRPPATMQLLLNYCFGHDESNLLLLPAAPLVNLINHASDGKEVNAFLQWSKHEYIYNEHDMHDLPLRDWDLENLPLIVMTLVSARDIREGEEILIDYGADWHRAWTEYQQAWDAMFQGVNPDGERNDRWPLKAVDVRSLYKDKPFPVDIKKGQLPYPAGVVTACFIESADDLPDGQPRYNAAGQEILLWLAPKEFKAFSGQNLAVCDLISREVVTVEGSNEKTYNYTVITSMKDEDSTKLVEVRKIPHEAITLVDRPYTGDIHTPGVFRRWISLEDQRFPQAWRNLRTK